MITAAQAREKVILSWSENDLQTHIVGLAAGLGWWSYHTHDSRRSNKGFPDLVLLHSRWGRSLFRELKSHRGRVSPEQRDVGDRMLAAGLNFGIWRPSDVVSGVVLHELQGQL